MFDSQFSMPVCREERLHVLAVIEGMIVPLRRDIAKSEPSPGVAHVGEKALGRNCNSMDVVEGRDCICTCSTCRVSNREERVHILATGP